MDGEKQHHEDLGERLAANVRTLREDAGMSQAALAAAMRERGVPWHQSTVARVEAGQQPVKLAEAVEVAAVLRTSLDRLTWTTREASAGIFLDQVIARAGRSAEQVAAWTTDLLYALHQLETSTGEAERAGCYDSDRIREIVREARLVLQMTPEEALAEGRKDYEELRKTGEQFMEEGEDDHAQPERQPRVHDQRET